MIHHPWQTEDDDIAPWENLICSPKIAEDDKMAIVIHWSSVRGFGILRSQVHGEVPVDEWGWMRSSRKMAGLSLRVGIGSASSSSFLGACTIVTSPNLCVFPMIYLLYT